MYDISGVPALRSIAETCLTCRDPIGICPLYWGRGGDGSMWFASEMKALQHRCVEFDIFPPVSPLPSKSCKMNPLVNKPANLSLDRTLNASSHAGTHAPRLRFGLRICFTQGHCYRSTTGKFERWYNPAWLDPANIPSPSTSGQNLDPILTDIRVRQKSFMYRN